MSTFAVPYIGGRKVEDGMTEEDFLASITEQMRSDAVAELAYNEFNLVLTEAQIKSPEKNARLFLRDSFKGKIQLSSDEIGVSFTTQGCPGAGKTEMLQNKLMRTKPKARKHFVLYGYDEYAALHKMQLWRWLINKIEDDKKIGRILTNFQYQQKKLAARDLVRDATAVVYDLIKNRTLVERFNCLNDTTVSSIHAVAGMQMYSDRNFVNHGLAMHAPLAESLKRCFERTKGISLEEEALGKRGPIMQNYAAYLDTIVRDGGSLEQFFTPDVNGKFRSLDAFSIVDGKIAERHDNVLGMLIDSLEQDINIFDDMVKEFFMWPERLNGVKESMEQGVLAFTDKLRIIMNTPVGARPEPTALG